MIDTNVFYNFVKVGAAAGIPCAEAVQNLQTALRSLPSMDPREAEALIRMNPNLSRLQRWRLIRWIRRTKNGGKGIDMAASV